MYIIIYYHFLMNGFTKGTKTKLIYSFFAALQGESKESGHPLFQKEKGKRAYLNTSAGNG